MIGSIPARRLKRFLAKAMASFEAFFLAGFGVTICVLLTLDLPRYPRSAMPIPGTLFVRLQYFLPCRGGGSVNVIGVWTKYANSPNFRYIGQLWKYLQLHREKISSGSTILCGDLNSNVQWDVWDRWWNHSDVVRELQEINIHSLYHHIMNEEQGKESKPTLFLHRKLEKPYHVDYVFISEDLLGENKNMIDVGSPDKWLQYSDHMPIVFSVAR